MRQITVEKHPENQQDRHKWKWHHQYHCTYSITKCIADLALISRSACLIYENCHKKYFRLRLKILDTNEVMKNRFGWKHIFGNSNIRNIHTQQSLDSLWEQKGKIIILINLFLIKYSGFTMLYQSLLYSKVHPFIHIYTFFSHIIFPNQLCHCGNYWIFISLTSIVMEWVEDESTNKHEKWEQG